MEYSKKPKENFRVYYFTSGSYSNDIFTYSEFVKKYKLVNDDNKELIEWFEDDKNKVIKKG